jgi:hypothetical protein
MVAASATPAPAQGTKSAANGKPAATAARPKTEVQKYLGKLQGARREAVKVARWAAACHAALAEAKKPEAEQAPIKKLAALLEGAEESIFKSADAVLSALVEAHWKAPQVKVAAGGVSFVEGAPVAFRKFHMQWGIDNGVWTEAEVKALVVHRITKGKGGVSWVTVRSEKTDNHFGPYRAGDKLTVR